MILLNVLPYQDASDSLLAVRLLALLHYENANEAPGPAFCGLFEEIKYPSFNLCRSCKCQMNFFSRGHLLPYRNSFIT